LLGAGAPKIPGVASLDFIRRKGDPAIHWLKHVFRDLRKIFWFTSACIVHQREVTVIIAAGVA
jgi:hypothetical protein